MNLGIFYFLFFRYIIFFKKSYLLFIKDILGDIKLLI